MVNETDLFYLVMLILHSSRSVCDRPPARREISPLNPIATKPQPQRQTKRRSRRFLFQSKFGYAYQQICQVVSREDYPSLSNPSRTNNVARRKHRSRCYHRAIHIFTTQSLSPRRKRQFSSVSFSDRTLSKGGWRLNLNHQIATAMTGAAETALRMLATPWYAACRFLNSTFYKRRPVKCV
jgi:hypothetical protein